MTTDPYVIVFPRMRVRGWDGDPTELQTLATHQPIKLIDALEAEFRSNACIVQYTSPGPDRERIPRLNKPSMAAVACTPPDRRPHLEVILLDVDFPNHDVPPEGWAGDIWSRVPEKWRSRGGWYRTPHGMRLIFIPPEPIPILCADGVIAWFHDQLTNHNVPVDEATKDWTRLFKAPKAKGRDLPFDYSNLAPILADDFLPRNRWTEVDPATFAKATLNAKQPSAQTVLGAKLTRAETKLIKDKALSNHIYAGSLAAPEGERHSYVLKAAIQIVRDTDSTTPHLAYKMLAQSLDSLNAGAGREMDLDELWRICNWACAQVVGSKEAVAQRANDSLEALAECMGVEPFVARQCVILDTGAQFYVWDEVAEDYSPAYKASRQLLPALHRHAPSLGMHFEKQITVLSELSSHVSQVVKSYLVDRAEYDPAKYKLTLPAKRIDPTLTPRYHREVHEWLSRLAPDEELRERFFDWLAVFPDLSLPICALYIDGPASIGKGLLAHALSRLWAVPAPTKYDELLKGFNPKLAECPLIWADESVPHDAFGHDDSGIFRRLVGNPNFRVEAKYQDATDLHGYMRVLMTANNPGAFSIRENLSLKDLEAVRLRLGYLQLKEDADGGCPPRDYLEDLANERGARTVRDVTQAWIDDGLVAEHVLWLAETRDVDYGSRFAVPGWESTLTRDLATSHGVTGVVVTTLVEAVISGRQWQSVRWFGGGVYVNYPGLPGEWKQIKQHSNRRPPYDEHILSALSALSKGEQVKLPDTVGTGEKRYWVIESGELARVAQRKGLAEFDEFVELCARDDESRSAAGMASNFSWMRGGKTPETGN